MFNDFALPLFLNNRQHPLSMNTLFLI